MLLLAGILAGCNETPVKNKGSTTEDASTAAVNVMKQNGQEHLRMP